MKTLLWLDDVRSAKLPYWIQTTPYNYYTYKQNEETHKVVWAKNYVDFVNYVMENGLPDDISFDHDLGAGKSGHECAKFLCEYCNDNNLQIPKYYVHSANPVGKENIIGLLESYKTFKLKDKTNK